ncbi:hypothetical protein HD806DRAFT_510263 [Xylariaceae sp. AK1471]|nr:hypothetical protein HD806DRAFT_510263 [Xylariaceae sp. AK1471]
MRSTRLAMALAATVSQILIASAADLPLPPLPSWYPLQPWQISSLNIYNPHTSPYGLNASGLVLTITNPKMIAASQAPHGGYVTFLNTTARCELHWKTDDLTPYGYSTNSCVPDLDLSSYSYPQWTMTLQELHVDLDGPGDYFVDLGFKLVHNSTIYGGNVFKSMSGGINLQSGSNLQGQCVEDGLCEYGIKDGSAPVLFQPVLYECKGACG